MKQSELMYTIFGPLSALKFCDFLRRAEISVAAAAVHPRGPIWLTLAQQNLPLCTMPPWLRRTFALPSGIPFLPGDESQGAGRSDGVEVVVNRRITTDQFGMEIFQKQHPCRSGARPWGYSNEPEIDSNDAPVGHTVRYVVRWNLFLDHGRP